MTRKLFRVLICSNSIRNLHSSHLQIRQSSSINNAECCNTYPFDPNLKSRHAGLGCCNQIFTFAGFRNESEWKNMWFSSSSSSIVWNHRQNRERSTPSWQRQSFYSFHDIELFVWTSERLDFVVVFGFNMKLSFVFIYFSLCLY